MAKAKPRRLGRGLSSLISEPVRIDTSAPVNTTNEAAAPAAGEPDESSRLRRIGLGEIVPNRHQPRKSFNDNTLDQLAASIRSSGVIQPIAVRPLRGADDAPAGARWELVAGERRWRAARLAGLDAIPAIVADLNEQEAAEWSLVENLQREDLDPMERAEALKNLRDAFNLTQEQIAKRVGIDRSSVANLIRITELEPEIRRMLSRGALTIGHGKALLSVEPPARRMRLAEACAAGGWSVRRLESEAQRTPSRDGAGGGTPQKQGAEERGLKRSSIRDLERRLGDHLGTKLKITTDPSGKSGKIVVRFFDLEHFDGLLERFGFSDRS